MIKFQYDLGPEYVPIYTLQWIELALISTIDITGVDSAAELRSYGYDKRIMFTK